MGPRTPLALAMTTVMVLVSVIPCISGVQAAGRLLTTPDGPVWTDDIRMTDNIAPDLDPYLFLDGERDSHIVWSRGSWLMYERLDMTGRPLVKERNIGDASPIFRDNGQAARTIGMDRDDGIHTIVKEDGLSSGAVIYERLANDGRTIVQPITLEQGIDMAPGADLMVAFNQNAYVLYDHYRIDFTKALSLSMIDPKGELVKHGIPIGNESWHIEGVSATTDAQSNLRALVNVWDGPDHGVWALTLDKYGVVPDGNQPQFLYSTTEYSYPTMPRLASCPSGDLMVLRYEDLGSEGRMTYLRLDGKNRPQKGHLMDIVVSEDATGDMDLVCEKDGVGHVVFTERSTGRLQYTSILNDKVSDPTRLTSEGSASSPDIVTGEHGALHLAWVDDRDGNKDIYYKLAYGKGLELGMSPQEAAKMMFIHCEEIKAANLTLKYFGIQNETVVLNVTTSFDEDGAWVAWIDEDELVLGPLEMAKLNIYIKGPRVEMSDVNDFILVNVTASLLDEPDINDTISFKVFTVCCVELRVDIADNVHITGAGQTTEFILTVRANFDLPETVGLSVEGNPDWEYHLSQTEVKMNEAGWANVVLFVTPPCTYCDDIGIFKVEAYVLDKPYIKDKAMAHVIVSCSMRVRLDATPLHQMVGPDTHSTEVSLTVTNEGNMGRYSVFIVEAESPWDDDVMFDRTSVALLPGRSEVVKATVFIPQGLAAGTRLIVNFTATSEHRVVWEWAEVIIEIGALHDLRLEVGPAAASASPGDVIDYDISMTNLGNCIESITLPIEGLPEGWLFEYQFDGDTTYEFVIRPGGTIHLKGMLHIPFNARSGIFDLKMVPANDEGMFDGRFLEVTVEQLYGIQIWSRTTRQVGLPGGHVTYPFHINNVGNGADTVTLDVEGAEGFEWAFLFGDDVVREMALSPDEKVEVLLKVDLPKQLDGHGFGLEAVFRSRGGHRDVKALSLEVQLPDLELVSVRYDPSNIRSGAPVMVEVVLANIGHMDAFEVVLSFFIGGEYYLSRTIGRLPVGERTSVTFDWVPEKGTNHLSFILDPDGAIMEGDEDNNRVDDVKMVLGKAEGLPGFELMTLGLAVMVVLVYRARTGRREQE